jgi:hypothetical protein
MTLRLNGSTSGYSEIDAPAVAGNQTFTLPGTGGTLDRLERAGNILQVVSTTKVDTFTTASSTFTDITGLSVSITPSSASNKILVFASVTGTGTDVSNAGGTGFVIVRDSTLIAQNTSLTNKFTGQLSNRSLGGTAHTLNSAVSHLDAPASTSALTYKIQGRCTAGTLHINRDIDNDSGSVSSLTLMEIAA